VHIDGVGFIPERTRVSIADREYTQMATITYSRITFTTLPQPVYTNRNWTVFVAVGVNEARCLTPPCHFSWATSVTPYFDTVTPQFIRGPTNLTLTGRNLLGSSSTTYTDIHVTINDSPCLLIGMSNDSVNCSVNGVNQGVHQILGSIDGLSLQLSLYITTNVSFCSLR
jgi:hypothetical protein